LYKNKSRPKSGEKRIMKKVAIFNGRKERGERSR